MSASKSNAQHIRDYLARDFDAPAQEIANKLEARGIHIDPQHVYQVRSDMRKKSEEAAEAARRRIQASVDTRNANVKPLAEYILQVLHDAPNGLKDHEILKKVTQAGYVTNSTEPLETLRKKLYELVQNGRIVRSGTLLNREYRLSEKERNNRPVPQPVASASVASPSLVAEPAQVSPESAPAQAQAQVPPESAPAQAQTQVPPPAQAQVSGGQRLMLDSDLLVDTLALVKKAGSIEALQPYLDTIRRL